MKKIIQSFPLLFLLLMSIGIESPAQNGKKISINWSVPTTMPPAEGMTKQLGLAGAFAGVYNGVMIIAGGANFPNGMPWKGGKKLHRDDIYILQKNKDGKLQWVSSATKHLAEPVAYGASISLPNGILCAGGETEKNGISKHVFMMQWDAVKKEINFTTLPSLPIPLANASITRIEQTIYIAGGETAGKISDAFFMMDLSALYPQWQALPSLPTALSHSVAVTHRGKKSSDSCVYILGGRCSTTSGISNLYSSVFCFDPATKTWTTLHPIGDGSSVTPLSAATGVITKDGILLIGGDKGEIFHKIETYNAAIAKATTASEKEQFQKDKEKILTHHPGFNKAILFYNIQNDSWHKISELPFYAPVTTTLVMWDGVIWIPGGEIMPGVRTPNILSGKIITP